MTAEARDRYHHGDLRNALLEGAVQLLAEGGVEAFTLRELARRVGVNHRAAYRHFEDKRAILAAVAADGYRALAAKMRAAVEASGRDEALERFLAMGRAYVEFGVDERARYEVMFGPRLNEDGRFPDLEVAISESVRVLSAELRRVAPDVPKEKIRDSGIAFLSTAHGFVTLRLTRRVRARRELLPSYATTVLRPVVRGIIDDLSATA
jgi:AcrR family transcriptional regulator